MDWLWNGIESLLNTGIKLLDQAFVLPIAAHMPSHVVQVCKSQVHCMYLNFEENTAILGLGRLFGGISVSVLKSQKPQRVQWSVLFILNVSVKVVCV